MQQTFENSIKIKVDKENSLVHLSIRSSEYKVEVFKLPLGDMNQLITSFSAQMYNSKDSHNGSNIQADVNPEGVEEENNNN
tara:strand:- start:645 stop:887 length:243 start_codon:yes stop_codon:yes gene_type:complete